MTLAGRATAEVLACALAIALTAGCGAADADDAGGSSGTRLVEHAHGRTEVPVDPQRVIAFDSTQEALPLAYLGVDVIGTIGAGIDPTAYIRLADPDVADRLDASGITSIGNEASGPDLEAIAALEPDLIIGGYEQAEWELLSEIAPTVPTPDYGVDPNPDRVDPYFVRDEFLAEVTGTTAELERLTAAYQERVADLRERYGTRWGEVDWVTFTEYPGGIGYVGPYNEGWAGYRALRDLGMPLSPEALAFEDVEGGMTEISEELFSEVDADVIFLVPDYDRLVQDDSAQAESRTLALLAGSRATANGQI